MFAILAFGCAIATALYFTYRAIKCKKETVVEEKEVEESVLEEEAVASDYEGTYMTPEEARMKRAKEKCKLLKRPSLGSVKREPFPIAKKQYEEAVAFLEEVRAMTSKGIDPRTKEGNTKKFFIFMRQLAATALFYEKGKTREELLVAGKANDLGGRLAWYFPGLAPW